MLATVSHLPHALAFTLVEMIASREDAAQLFSFAGAGFRDFTRIAGSSPEMWRDICLLNRDSILSMIEEYEKTLLRLKELVRHGDGKGLETEFERAKQVREKLS